MEGGRDIVGGKNVCASVRTKLLWRTIYCAKQGPDTGYQSGSQSHRWPGRRGPRIMWYQDLKTMIRDQMLTQPHTFEMGSSSVSSMSFLKVVSTTRDSFPSMPSTDRKNGGKYFRYSWECVPCLSFFCFNNWSSSLSIGSYFQVSVSASQNQTLIMASVWMN